MDLLATVDLQVKMVSLVQVDLLATVDIQVKMVSLVLLENLVVLDLRGRGAKPESKEVQDNWDLQDRRVVESHMLGGVALPAQKQRELNWYTEEELLEVSGHQVVEVVTINVSLKNQRTLISVLATLQMQLTCMVLNMKRGTMCHHQYTIMTFPVLCAMLLLVRQL